MPEYITEPIISPTISGLLPEGERKRRFALTSLHPEDREINVPNREITCYECGKKSSVPAAALSANCIHCHAHLNMADMEMKPGSRRLNLRTLGQVHIPADTVLSHVSVLCRELTMLGRVSGRFRVAEGMSISSNVRIDDVVEAGKLIINKGAHVVLARDAELNELEVYGRLDLEGTAKVRGSIILHSGARLQGDCHARERHMESGAEHEGIFLRIGGGADSEG